MDKLNGKNNATNKMSNSAESLMDAASLFGAYWTRGDNSALNASSGGASGNAALTTNLFAAAAAAGVYHPLMGPMAILPPALAAAAAAAATTGSSSTMSTGGRSVTSDLRGMCNLSTVSSSGYSIPTSSAAVTAVSSSASSTAAYNNAYTNTLSAAASQAASLQGMSAWWSMAQQFAAHDYVTRMQASALNIPGGFVGNPAALGDPYTAVAALTLSAASVGGSGVLTSHKSHGGSSSKGGNSKSRNAGKNQYSASNQQQQQQQLHLEQLHMLSGKNQTSGGSNSWRKRDKFSSHSSVDHKKLSIRDLDLISAYGVTFKDLSSSISRSSSVEKSFNTSPNHLLQQVVQQGLYGYDKGDRESIYTMATASASTAATASPATITSASTNFTSTLPNSILSDPHTVLGDVRLPPDTEIIKYTSSIVGPKIPGTTNRGRKKTISLDHGTSGSNLSALIQQQHHSHQQHPALAAAMATAVNAASVTGSGINISSGLVQPSAAHAASSGGSSLNSTHSNILMDTRNAKRPKLDTLEGDHNSLGSNRVEVIKLSTKNGSSTSTSNHNYRDFSGTGNSEVPLNLSLKPSSKNANHNTSSSISSLSNMSVNIGLDRISRRKPGPKPRRHAPTTPPLPQTTSVTVPNNALPPGAPSASLAQLFATAAAPDDAFSSLSSRCDILASGLDIPVTTSMSAGKDSRPRNLGRGVSKPKKNTVASLLAQSRALGIKPVPILDPNASMSQQMSLLKSNILAAQQYIAEVGGDEKTLNKFLQDKIRGTLSDSSTVDASTDSDNLTDSNQTDSELESSDMQLSKRSKQYDEIALRVPLEKGWKRETIIRGITKNGAIRGDVIYAAPESNNKFKQMSDITQYLDYQKSKELTKENFTFSCRVILGDYIHMIASDYNSDGEYVRMSEEDVIKRLDDLKASIRTNIPVEQRIEVARRQQAARAAARLDREQARLTRELERSERQENARRDKETKTQQIFEAKKKKQEEMERHKQEEQHRKQQMYIQEVNKQRELLYTVELERERRRQHMTLVKALENRRKLEDRERKKLQILAEKQANKDKKIEQRRIELDILNELRKPCEDLELEQKSLPEFDRIPGLKLPAKAFGDILMVFEFLHNFGETLGFDMESLPSLDTLQQALLVEEVSNEAEEDLLSIMTHLIVCAIEDPGIPNPARHTTLLGQSLRSADITHANVSEILRIYLYANATGEVKTLTGVSFERDREKRVADHHQTDSEMQSTQGGKNATYYEKLHANPTWQMADMLRDKPFVSLSPTNKAAILSFICNELLQNKAVIRQIDNSMETVAVSRKEKWILDAKARKLKTLYNKKIRTEAMEKAIQTKADGLVDEIGSIESPALHKDDLLDDDEIEMNLSEDESVGTQPEEEEDVKLSAEELSKKLEKAVKTAVDKLSSINAINHQMRATCYGQDRFFRRYWSLPRAGGIFIEAMESADPNELILQFQEEQLRALYVKTLDDIDGIIADVDEADMNADNEVSEIIGQAHTTENNSYEETVKDEYIDDSGNENRNKTPKRFETEEFDHHKLSEPQRDIEIIGKLDPSIAEFSTEAYRSKNEINVSRAESASIKDEDVETDTDESKEFHMFDKLTEYMEAEAMKDSIIEEFNDLKDQILIDIKTELIADGEAMENNAVCEYIWFSVLNKDGTCEGVQLCSGNKWDNAVGICTMDNVMELKIPVFPQPGSNTTYTANTCDSPAPLQITPEELVQMEYIKEHGLPKPVEKSLVSLDMRYGWWRILNVDTLKTLLVNLHVRGARERELKRSIINIMQSMYEQPNKLYIESGSVETTSLCGYDMVSINQANKQMGELESADDDYNRNSVEKRLTSFQLPTYIQSVSGLINVPKPDSHDAWLPHIAQRVDMTLLEQVEALEDKVANASMQMKGWKIPVKGASDTPANYLVQAAKERLSSLEAAIERRYLKPPLGVIISDPNLVAIAQEAAAATASTTIGTSSCTFTTASSTNLHTLSSSTTTNQDNLSSNQQSYAHANAVSLASFNATSAPILRSASPQHHLHVELTPGGGNLFCATPVLPNNNGANSAAAALAQLDDVPKALAVWRDGVFRAQTSAQLAMCLYTLEASIAWDKSIMKANCQFCKSGDNEDKLLLCDSCDKGYHTYCFKPKIDTIPDGDWYCHECMNKAKGEKNCIVCGKKSSNTGSKLIACELCPRAYHTDCIRPNMSKAPRGKWYCSNCISKKPQKKTPKKNGNKRDLANNNESSELQAPASPTLSHSSATTNEDMSLTPQHHINITKHRSLSPLPVLNITAVTTGNKQHANSFITTTAAVNITTSTAVTPPRITSTPICQQEESPSLNNTSITATTSVETSPQTNASVSPTTAAVLESVSTIDNTSDEATSCNSNINASASLFVSNSTVTSAKKDKISKKILKELVPCRAILEDLECHDDAWPFLLPVNTKQFPTYKKIIKNPMDLSTVKKKMLDGTYKNKEDFSSDVRQIFNNCEIFNEDDSPVGKAGHCMRQFFELRWNDHFLYTILS